MKIENLKKNLIIDSSKLFAGLNEREQDVLKSRYGIESEKKTLSAIGQGLTLSRERIRQIENRAKAKLCSNIQKLNDKFFVSLKAVIEENGNFLSENTIAENLASDSSKINLAKLIMDVSPDFEIVKGDSWIGRSWRAKNLSISKINGLISLVENKLKEAGSPVKAADLVQELEVKDGFDKQLFFALTSATNKFLSQGERIGLTSDRAINPKTVADKVLYILEETKRPIHFAEIAEEIEKYGFDKKKINKLTVHNELIANDKFVLIGRGIYAMKKWGYREGTLEELIIDFLKKQDKPQTLTSIIDHISRERDVKRNAILVNLAKCRQITRTTDGSYQVA